MKALAEDPRGQGGVAPSGSWKPGTSGAVPFLWNLTTFLPSAIPVWAGSHASLGDLLLKPWLSDTYVPTEPRITYYVNSDDTWHLDLWWRQRDLGAEARIKALELTLECVAVFADVPQYAPRAATFTAMLRKVLDDPELRKLHEEAAWDVIAKTWREQVCTEQDAQTFSEGRGWTSQLVWSISGLDAAHQVLSNVVSRAQSADEVIASMALHDAVDELPAALAAAVGSERFGAINTAFERLKPGFDGEDWMSDNRGWLARGMVNGEIDAVRLWLAMATQVAELVAGLPSFARSTSCPSRTGYLDDLTGVFRAPPAVVNPMATKLLEDRRNQRLLATAGTTVDPRGRPALGDRGRRGGARPGRARGRDRRPDGRARGRWSAWRRSRSRSSGWSPSSRRRSCAPRPACRPRRSRGTWSSPATPAPRRPPWPGCWPGSTPSSACSRTAT